MKRTSKNLLFFSIIFFIVITGVIFVIIFSTPDPQSDVIVSYQRPASFDRAKPVPSKTAPVEMVAPEPAVKETPIPENERAVKIQDPFGDPIPAGTVAFGSESLSFTSGNVIIPATAPQEFKAKVTAEGYSPGEFTITANSSPLVLDYLCDFSILVEDEKGDPVPDVLIRVWTSNPPPRPTGDQAAAYACRGLSLENTFRLTRIKDECRVMWVDKPRDLFYTYGSPDGEVFPKIGDLVMALGACTWQARYNPLYIQQGYRNQRSEAILGGFLPLTDHHSSRLRIWDTLRLSEQADSNLANIHPQVLEILRENQLQYYYLSFPEYSDKQVFLCKEKANDKGEWKLHGVPPAIYYVQAIDNQNRRSEIMPLHPACGGARLPLIGEGELDVYIEQEGIPAKEKLFSRIPDAETILQSQTGIKLYSKKTDDSGEARYEKLPYGEYRLTVKAQGQTVEKNIVINKVLDSCYISFPHEELYNISGILIEQDSGMPVPDHTLELSAGLKKDIQGHYIYQEVISDAKGRFEFHDILPGKYTLAETVKSTADLKYIFSKPSYFIDCLDKNSFFFYSIDLNVYENISDLKILVKPVVKTNFSGITVDKNNIPVANAVIAINTKFRGVGNNGKTRLYPEDFKTDATGLFSLTIFSGYRNELMKYDYEVTAMTGKITPPKWVPHPKKPDEYNLIQEKFQADSIGSVTVEGHMGDTFKDLRIVMEPHITDKILFGKLTETDKDENQFSKVFIEAIQNSEVNCLNVDENGNFKAENISSGDMMLIINPCIRTPIETPKGILEYNKYLSRRVTIQIKEGQPQTFVEIPLQRSGYYWGYVKDNNGNPLPEAAVWAEDKPNPNGHSYISTDSSGFFFINSLGMVKGKRYNIKYDVGGQVKVMPNVPPNTGNLVLE